MAFCFHNFSLRFLASNAVSWRKLHIGSKRINPLPRPAAFILPDNPCVKKRKRVILQRVAVLSAGGKFFSGVVFFENTGL